MCQRKENSYNFFKKSMGNKSPQMFTFKANPCLNFKKLWGVVDRIVFLLIKERTKDKNCWKPEHHIPIHITLIIYQEQGQQYEIFMYEYHPASYKSNTWKIRSEVNSKIPLTLGYSSLNNNKSVIYKEK